MVTAAPPRGIIALPYPHAGQQVVLRQARRFNWLAAGRRWRKTTLAMIVAVQAALRGERVLWGAPVYDQVRVGWDEMRSAVAGASGVVLNQTRMTAVFPGGGVIVYRSLDHPDNARGHSADGVIVDEAADVDGEAWYEVLRPMLMDTNGWAWFLGTPKGRNWFWHEHQAVADRDDSIAWQIPTVGCLLDEHGRVQRHPHPLENPNIAFREIEELARTTPPNTFRQEIMSEFVASAVQIFLPEWWDATPEHEARRFDAADTAHVHRCVARWLSWDTAFTDTQGAAYTACVVGELTPDYRLFIREVWRDKVTFPSLMAKLHALAARYNTDDKLQGIIIESKASGISAAQTLVETAEPWLARLVLPFAPEGSKEHRAELAAVWCLQGCVWLPEPSAAVPWLRAFEDELWSFPSSPNSDQVDSFSQLLLHVSRRLTQGREARERAAMQAAQEREAA